MLDTRMPLCYCPHCKTILTGAMSADDQTPEPGDITICYKCRESAMFDDDLKLIEAPEGWENDVVEGGIERRDKLLKEVFSDD